MEGTKWMATVASIWIQVSCGASYTFGIYSPILKSTQGYDQSTLDTISVFKDIGANVGVLAGLFYSAVCQRRLHSPPSFWRQPWVVHAVGAILCFVGYFFLWLAVTGAIPRPPVAVTCFFIFVAAQALTFFNTANIVTSVQNFPAYGGTIVGIMKGFLGLSAAILIQIYQVLFAGNASAFLLMLAVVSPLFSIVLMFFVRVHETPSNSEEEKRHLNAFSLIAIAVAAYIMFLIIVENVVEMPHSMHALAFALLIILLSSPLSVAIKAHTERKASSTLPNLEAPLIEDDPDNTKPDDKIGDEITTVDLDVAEDLNVVQAMRTLNFWLLFIAMFCAMGSGLATINNITQMGESLGYTNRERNALVSLWSVWNFLGRFVAGYVSDVFLHKKGLPRPFFMPVTLAAMTTGHLIISSGIPGNLYIGSVLVGICFGSQWSLMPTMASEIFGVTHMGTIFNTIAVASPLGSYILSVRVIGYLYDREAAGGMGDSCIGIHCFRLSFFILASVSVVGFLVSLILLARTRGIYARIVRRRMWA